MKLISFCPSIFAFVILFLVTPSYTSANFVLNTHICIIGGGVSGLTVANSLQDKGYKNVHLFEAGYTLKQVKKGNLTTIPFELKDISLIDPERGLIFPKLTYSPVVTAKIKNLTDKFKSYWGELSQSGALEMGYNSAGSNEKLDESMPIDKWLSGHNLSELIPIFNPPITAQGYGDVKNIAVLYAMKLIVAEDVELLSLIGDDTALQTRPYYTGYSWIYGDYTDPANGADIFLMLNKLTTTLRKIHPLSRTLFTSVTDYFPHVSGESIRDGFYRDFDSIQADGGLYYATTLLTPTDYKKVHGDRIDKEQSKKNFLKTSKDHTHHEASQAWNRKKFTKLKRKPGSLLAVSIKIIQ
ncbi:Salicylate hydroxylase [Folsomia candida]|uniref:Salicylate hydroxylase n=1 Tax=Folsomia candida TaxID=158441 RepID=A0A226DV86_FOLCA|nr:Salicylate hydroxylase [Folsomia candida]